MGAGLMTKTTTTKYLNEGDLVWVCRQGYEDCTPKSLRSRGLVTEVLPPPNQYWYRILQTTPSGTTQMKCFPIEMLIKIEDND
jgi:hypothetical protein